MTSETCDVAVIGGGVMGASLAFWLTRMGAGRVVVFEKDPSYAFGSTGRSAASIRQQFSTAVNIEISAFGIEFLRKCRDILGLPDISDALDLRENGYLFLAGSAESEAEMRRAVALQREMGAATELLTAEELDARFGWFETSDVRLASFGPRDEGWFDNMGLLTAFRRAAIAGGAEFRDAEVTGVARAGARITGVTLTDGQRIAPGVVVNAAGTAAARVMTHLGENIPVEPRKRTVFFIDAPDIHRPDAPLMIDHLGFYVRPENDGWICAIVPEEDGPADPGDFEPDLHDFEVRLWPRLFARCEGFGAVKVKHAWAGHYAFNTFDQNAIVGWWPGIENLCVMNGFSGHGLQQAPAVGRGLAELIVSGSYQSIDLTALSADRLFSGQPLVEAAIV